MSASAHIRLTATTAALREKTRVNNGLLSQDTASFNYGVSVQNPLK